MALRFVIMQDVGKEEKVLIERDPVQVKFTLSDKLDALLSAQEKWHKKSFRRDEIIDTFQQAYDLCLSSFKRESCKVP